MIKRKPSLRIVTNDDGSMTMVVSFGLYSKNAVFKACNKYLEKAHIKIASTKKEFVVDIISKKPEIDTSLVVKNICNDLIDFELRETIAKETKDIRTALVQRAFSNLSTARFENY